MTNNSNNFFEEQRRYYNNQYNQQEQGSSEKTQQSRNSQGNNFKSNPNVDMQAQTFKKLAEYYNKNGEDKLIEDIFTTVKAQKANGTLTNEQLLKFAKSVYPMLNNSQREKIKQLLPKLLEDWGDFFNYLVLL